MYKHAHIYIQTDAVFPDVATKMNHKCMVRIICDFS